MERTLVIIKPDGVQRSLIGDVIGRFERVGLKLVGMKMAIPTKEQIEHHYTVDPEWKKNTGEKRLAAYAKSGQTPPSTDPMVLAQAIIDRLAAYMSSGPVVIMAWQGAHSVAVVRKLVGSTEPLSSDVGTIRGDYVLDSYAMSDGDDRAVRNVVHASGSVADAEKELKHWFDAKELLDYRLIQDQILYDVNLDGITE